MSSGYVLAIDTTGEFGSLALARNGEVVVEHVIHSPDGFGHILFERIAQLLGVAGIGLNDVALFAAAAGPGSFTGVRVGLAAAKGLAEAMGTPAAGISNLRALADLGEGASRAVILDARRGEVFAAVYSADGAARSSECVMKFPEWLAALGEPPDEFVFLDEAPFGFALDASRFAGVPRRSAGRALAGAVARLAWSAASDPAALDANYVRRSDAELAWTDKQ